MAMMRPVGDAQPRRPAGCGHNLFLAIFSLAVAFYAAPSFSAAGDAFVASGAGLAGSNSFFCGRSLESRSMQSSTAMQGYHGQLKKPKWVEPTLPEELVQQAKEDGFRLRPKYVHMKIGYVIADKQKKTRICLVEYFLFNSKYGVYYKRSKKKHFHDEYELSKLGDVVLITPYRKLSNMKSYRLVEIMKKGEAPTHV
eukprot:TRINITY_DN4797_c0_g1_i2.p1 TRINITY_DN4797_c0_g1~~TRINITY_DN4797_c0_g1_i2.p1  ORF type:complete len:197 (+),score=44.03 TRINITY_DN4797_c0_g1_i2:71-661(+)